MVAPAKSSPPPADRTLILSRTFNAPRSLVFQVWTDPEHLVRWFGPKDFTLPFCETDFRPGGAYRFCMRSPEGKDFWVWGHYREIVLPERLAFTWMREDPVTKEQSESLVTLTFVERDGRTTLTLHHAVFDTVQDRDDHQGGWGECLDRLVVYVSQI